MIHAVTCFFNPCGYTRIRDNYARFRDALRGCRLHTIELSFTGEFTIPDAMHVSGGPKNVMWQKERLLNLLVERLPDDVTHVAWIDADLLFCNPDWAQLAFERLQEFPVVQLFQSVHYLNPHGRIVRSRPSLAVALAERRTMLSAPGGAWAARRDVFPLLDTHILGGGDKLLAEAWRGNWAATSKQMNVAWAKAFIEDGFRQHQLVQGRIGLIPGDVLHCWHGEYSKRKYTQRWRYLTDHRFDPRNDIAIDGAGLWRWSSDKPEMHRLVAGYFEERQDDG